MFALTNLPEAVKGALFARYSRTTKSLRRLFLDEFADDVGATGRARRRRSRRAPSGSTTACSSSTATTPWRSSAGCTSRASRRRSCWRRRSSGGGWPPTSSSRRATCATTTSRGARGARPCPPEIEGTPLEAALPRVPRRGLRRVRTHVRADGGVLRQRFPRTETDSDFVYRADDHGEDVRHAARAAAGRDAVEPGDLRDRAVLRTAPDAPGGASARPRCATTAS